MRRAPLIVLAAVAASITAVQGTCFVPNGTNRNDIKDFHLDTYEPCVSSGHAMCCNIKNGDRCEANGLCWNNVDKKFWRESCTDPTWQSPKCLKLCISDDYQSDGIGATGTDIVVTECADESYCCGNDNQRVNDCCEEGKGVRIEDGQVVTTSSLMPTASSAGASGSAPSNNQAGIIGGAVGGAVGAVVLALAAWFIWHKRRKSNARARGDAADLTQNYVAVSQEGGYPTVVEAPSYYPPAEMPGEGHPVELGSESVRSTSRR
ncbi:hypothetical protein CGLO_08031 [Colletotrichum gloeosporioides Cg-14]|uniref:Uncharacterized protein n=1 Tax=Colletotrichum gloeosporioides (strain Cg-14) TaxID=1237896 RepID=T0K9W7_COLGC|nr:hypothetical protein CGLO_08031 [Colletotrichum gloeosporioides Cg-14]